MFQNFPPSWLRMPHRDDSLFGVVFFTIFIVPLLFVSVFLEGYETVKYPLFLLLTGVGVLVLITRPQVYVHKFIMWLLGGFVAITALSAIFSLDVINSVIGLYSRYTGSVFFIAGWVLFILLVWNAVKQDEQRRLTLLRVLFFDGLAIALLGITQYFNIAYYGGVSQYSRTIIPSFVGNQNFFAMFLLVTIPLGALLWQTAKGRAAKYYYIIAAAIMTWAIVLSGSRGALLGLVASLIVFLVAAGIRKYPKSVIYWVLGLGALAAVLYVGFFAIIRSDTIKGVAASDYTAETRYVIWSDTLSIIKDNPFLGTGPGNFFIAFGKLGNSALSSNERFDDAHNLVLQLTATFGVPAALLFLIIIGIAIFLAWRETAYGKQSAIWVIAAVAGWLVAASFNPVSVPLWMILGLMVAFGTSYTSVQRDLKIWPKIGLIVPAVILGLFALSFISSEVFSGYGITAYKKQDNTQAEKLLSKALALNHFNNGAQLYLAAAKINLHRNEKDIVDLINLSLHQHGGSAGTYVSTADLYYRLYITTHNEEYKNKIDPMFEQAKILEPNFGNIYGGQAYADYKLGKVDQAHELLNHQLSFSNSLDYPYSWILLSKIYFDQGQKQKSIDAMEKAYQSLTDQPLIKYFLLQMRSTDDISKLTFPVSFPDIDI
ncbi:MAG TPA: O-antigen ligase family protein [Patescibacteria group bacterium]|jgi:putative inorganic carbon (HCO3(-)) transporter|nr:O-antigen ligase family protein [Patescibacteria group bacterium]